MASGSQVQRTSRQQGRAQATSGPKVDKMAKQYLDMRRLRPRASSASFRLQAACATTCLHNPLDVRKSMKDLTLEHSLFAVPSTHSLPACRHTQG